MNIKSSQSIIGASLVFVGAILFAAKAIIVKYSYIHYGIDALSLLVLRMLFSLPFYLIILLREKRVKKSVIQLSKKEWMSIFLLGLVGYYLASFFDFLGLQYITASIERIILFIYPTLVVLLSIVFFKKKITKNQYIALFITYIGVIIAFLPDIQLGVQKGLLIGSSFIFLSAVTYSIYLIGSGELIPKIGTVLYTCYAMMVSTIAVILHYFIVEFNIDNLFHFPIQVYILGAVMAIFSTVIPSFMVSEGIKRIGSSNASIIGSIGPIATIIMANIVLGEQITLIQLIGTSVVLYGVLLISTSKT